MNPLQSLLELLMSQAQPRPQLGQRTPVATFAGRVVGPEDTNLLELLSRPPQESPDAEGMGGLAKAAMGVPAVAAGLRAPTAAEAAALKELVLKRANMGVPMLRQNFRPMLETPQGRQVVGGLGGYHSDLYERLRNFEQMARKEGKLLHGFATETGTPVPDELFHVLTGPPATLMTAGEMIKAGTPMDALIEAIQWGLTKGRSAVGGR